MFERCSKLISLDLRNFNTLNTENIQSMFKSCSDSLIYCINPDNDKTANLLNNIQSNYNFKNNNLCSDNCFVENKKLIFDLRKCVLICTEEYKYDYKNICYSSCPEGTHSTSDYICINDNYESINTIISNDKYTTIITTYLNNYLTENISNKVEITNPININEYTTIITTYFNNYLTEKMSNKDEITNTINIDKYSTIITDFNNYLTEKITNRYKNINSDNYLSDGITNKNDILQKNNYSTNIPIKMKTESLDKKDIISTFSDKIYDNLKQNDNYNFSSVSDYEYVYFINNMSKLNNNSNSKNIIITTIREELIKGNLDIFIFNLIEKEKKDLIFKENKIIYQLTSIYNQKYNEYINISSIYFGECETILRKHYNISNNISLLILKSDINEEGFLIPFIEYEVYDSKSKQKLDLNLCSEKKIIIYLPVIINEKEIFKYNTSHEYFNDICFSYTTDNNTDIILKDRRDEYINNNMSLCEQNCNYNGYEYNTKKSICECLIKIKFPLISEIIINKDKFLNNFVDLKKQANLNVMKCYNELFSKEGLINNLGNYLISSIILSIVILCILFKIKGFKKLKNQINKIINIKNNKNNKNNKIFNQKNKEKKGQFLNKKNKETKIKNENMPPKKKKNCNINIKNINILKTNGNIKNKSTKKKKKSKLKEKNTKIYINILDNSNSKVLTLKNINLNDDNKVSIQKNINYNDYELNNLKYKDALKLDKRTYVEYY